MVKLNRRKFFALSAAGLGTALAGNWLNKEGISSEFLVNSSTNLANTYNDIYTSQNGLLELDLEAKESVVDLNGNLSSLLTYNEQIPAPRLEAKPGDTVRIHFSNNLAQPTNIHYHGLHIPITGKADNVFLRVEPGEKFIYEFEIPANHPAGTFLYHPHLHGLVAEQLFGGLAGLFIVRGELDEIPEIKAAQEKFLVLQDFSLDVNGERTNSAHMSLMMGREGNIITVNGRVNPSFSFANNGSLLRLRILNASPSRFYRLALESHSFYQIATDGHSLNNPVEVKELLLTPGQRADVLVSADHRPGKYQLFNLPYDRGAMGMMGDRGMMGGRMMDRDNREEVQAIATINYGSVEHSSLKSLPSKLAEISALPEPQKIRSFELNHGMSPGVGMAFLINGKPYEHKRIDTEVKLNTIEDWELVNTGVMDHPFHIHGNAFQVISRNDKPESILAWRDTVLVKRGETIRIRILFRDFSGKTVYHCHILDHEDLGMMGNLMISPA